MSYSVAELGLRAGFNIICTFLLLLGFSLLRIQPFADRVYYFKWYSMGIRDGHLHRRGTVLSKYLNTDFNSYLTLFNWIKRTLKMPELELIEHAGLDSVVYVRIYLLGLKIFVPVKVLSILVLFPANISESKAVLSDIKTLSISNLPYESPRFLAHLGMAYAITLWSCLVLYKEYEKIAAMRLQFLAAEKRRPDQYTVLVRNIPPDADKSISELVEHFFSVNHPDHYLTHQMVLRNPSKLSHLVRKEKRKQNQLDSYQLIHSRKPDKRPLIKTGFLGRFGEKVDAIHYYFAEIERLTTEIAEERQRVEHDSKFMMPAAFVSFKSRWGAAVCAQTQQTRNPTIWLTEWAPEPSDLYWRNIAIPYVHLIVRRRIVLVAFIFFLFFFMIPVELLQYMTTVNGTRKFLPSLLFLYEKRLLSAFIQGYLPGLIFMFSKFFLATLMMMMSKFEGFEALSVLDRRSAARYYVFNLVNIILVTVFNDSPIRLLKVFIIDPIKLIDLSGERIPMKTNFFMNYIMIDGWFGAASEILRLKPLITYHLMNWLLVKTEKDREAAADAGSLGFEIGEPQIQLYVLLAFLYAVVSPIILPFILVFFGLSYLVYRYQIINVYKQKYESAGAFWPAVHGRIITTMVFSQVLLMGLLRTKGAGLTPFVIALPILTTWFHRYCKGRFEPSFKNYPLQEAMIKDTLDHVRDPDFNLRAYLQDAYIHPVFKDGDDQTS